MNPKQQKSISKFLSLILRHRPETVGVELDEAGWVSVDELLEAIKASGRQLTRDMLETVVRENDKQRFAFNEDATMIRASQGHSVDVELQYQPTEPPEFLYHGTPQKFVRSIQDQGLKKMSRHHVHLHEDVQVATTVGKRRGVPVVLTVQSGQMHRDGFEFFVSENRVWLVDNVPAKYIEFPNG